MLELQVGVTQKLSGMLTTSAQLCSLWGGARHRRGQEKESGCMQLDFSTGT